MQPKNLPRLARHPEGTNISFLSRDLGCHTIAQEALLTARIPRLGLRNHSTFPPPPQEKNRVPFCFFQGSPLFQLRSWVLVPASSGAFRSAHSRRISLHRRSPWSDTCNACGGGERSRARRRGSNRRRREGDERARGKALVHLPRDVRTVVFCQLMLVFRIFSH